LSGRDGPPGRPRTPQRGVPTCHRRIHRFTIFLKALAALLLQAAFGVGAAGYHPGTSEPPWVQREFRGVWVATVANIDWPSNPGLPVAQQKAELIAILDRAQRLNLNAVVFQVRPCCDAFYESKLEPWSYYLTGEMGRAPSPYYDPLAFAVGEAHRRGLQLHAWFSPYRASHPSQKAPFTAAHVSRVHPDWVHKYGDQLWIDPGNQEAQNYTVRVILDVVNRYDIDGVTFDDRLGYPEPDPQHKNLDFPDAATYRRYRESGGKLERDDWRRENVDTFVHHVYDAVKSAKPWVQVGIAPRGIWQNGYPPSIKGGSSYSLLFTDSRKWLMNGWLDYCAPQLYWNIAQSATSFPVLLNWWRAQNTAHRNLWPGLYTENFATTKQGGAEIVAQVKTIRDQCDGKAGEIHYSAKCLVQNLGGMATALASSVYALPATVPSSPWLEQGLPGKPVFSVEENGQAKWTPTGMMNGVSVWLWQVRTGGQWQTRILPGETRGMQLTGMPDVLALTAIDRCGMASPPVVLQRDAH
jgi:uncharacterized lipoprotein YddW (UPF0748 family)